MGQTKVEYTPEQQIELERTKFGGRFWELLAGTTEKYESVMAFISSANAEVAKLKEREKQIRHGTVSTKKTAKTVEYKTDRTVNVTAPIAKRIRKKKEN